MASNRILNLVLALLCAPAAIAQTNSISFSFTIPSGPDTTTSAAVLDSNGVMVKTLWGNVSYPPGTYSGTWDGTLDVAATSTPGAVYTIKLLMNNVTYTYDGHFGSTDAQWYNPQKYEQLCGWNQGIPKITFSGNSGWVACGYTEGANNIMRINPSQPNFPVLPNASYAPSLHETDDIVSDNNWVYLMEHRVGTTGTTVHNFVTAIDASSSMPAYFSAGTLDSTFIWQSPILSATYIDLVDYPSTDVQTGIAVQRSGTILAVAHATTGTIKLFNKTTGASVGTVSGVAIPAINTVFTPMAFTSEGLWYVSDGRLYLITGLPSSPVITQPIGGFSYVSAIGSNAATNGLYVADGGTHQQVFEYAVNTHALLRTIGVAGGYNDCNPTVTHTRLMLDDYSVFGANNTGSYFKYVFVQSDDNDNVWIGDMRGQRIQHFDASGNYVAQILYRRPSYYAVVSETMPTRLFMEMLEYTVNYNVTNVPGDPDPALGGNGSWVLAKNWQVCALGAGGSPLPPNVFQGIWQFISVEQLSNGRVYAQMYNNPGTFRNIFELPTNGTSPARNTGVAAASTISFMQRNGDLSSFSVTGVSPTKTITVNKQTLTGFDGSNNPIYSAVAPVISTTTNSSNVLLTPGLGGSMENIEPTTGGYYPIFQTATVSTPRYPHAAAIKAGFSSYAWTTMPEATLVVPDYRGSFPGNGSGAQGISSIKTEGRNIIFPYAGNAVAWGSQFYHYYEDGMMIGQFGMNQAFPKSKVYPSHPTNFSNSNAISTTVVNGDIYVYVGDEAYAPGHRWHISGLDTVHEWSGSATLQANGSANLVKIF